MFRAWRPSLEGQTNNKIDSVNRKGKNNVQKYVVPYLKALRQDSRASKSMPTGSAAVEGAHEEPDLRELVDWAHLEAKSKWPNLRVS